MTTPEQAEARLREPIDDLTAQALIAIAHLDAARIHANAVHQDLIAHGAQGLLADPNSMSEEEHRLRNFINPPTKN